MAFDLLGMKNCHVIGETCKRYVSTIGWIPFLSNPLNEPFITMRE